MNIYNILADNYSEIFPLDPARADFILSFTGKKESEILDLGCATGDFCIDLYKRGALPAGIDLNERMIEIAKNKACGNIPFFAGDMVFFNSFFPDKKWDSIICFGNTLPHLPGLELVDILFKSVYNNLKEEGSFIVQVLNYDYILKQESFSFPELTTENFSFTRNYDFRQDERILFTINLTDNSSGTRGTDSTSLLPLGEKNIKKAALSAGFIKTELYSGYDYKEVTDNSPVILYCMKKFH